MFKSIKVSPSNTDTRIDKWLKREFSNLNQSFIEKNLRKGLIKINNSKVKSSYIVSENDIINIFNFSIEKYPFKIKKKILKKYQQ